MKLPDKKAIKSYVKREGRMTERQQQAIAEQWELYGLSSNAGLIDFAKAFGREAPLVLEIGFGMGQSLLQMAMGHPEQNYIGIEVHRPGVGALLAEMKDQGVENIRLFNEDTINVLNHSIENNSLSEIWILFPDPWPKTRHWKRRLIQPEFTLLLQQKLKVGGCLRLATDWQDYAKQMMKVLTVTEGLINVCGNGEFLKDNLLRPLTKFERRGRLLGHQIFDLSFKKNPPKQRVF